MTSLPATILAGDLRSNDLSQRRADLLGHPNAALNGIDYVEIDPADHTRLRIVFLRPVPAGGYGFIAQPGLIEIKGGVRVTGVKAILAALDGPLALRITVNVPGDFSPYVLTLSHPNLDPPLSQLTISFTATCPTDVDCETDQVCPPEELDEPLIDYLAKDYASFRRLLQEVAAARHGSYTDGNAADLAETLIELLAYAGDQLSYLQDAAATEAYLDTARDRRSVRRHALLVDYRMHEGRNAWTWAALSVGQPGTLPAGTPLLSRVSRSPLPGGQPPGVRVDAALLDPAFPDRFERNYAFADVVVFETAHDVQCAAVNNEVQIHTWGNDECWLTRGAREAYLFSIDAQGQATRPSLRAGDYLVIEEVRGSSGNGLPADAERRNRCVVRIEEVPAQTTDALYADTLVSSRDPASGMSQWELQPWTAGAALPLLHVRWRREDALAFPICLSSTTEDNRRIRGIAVARGNVVLADHGRTVQEVLRPVIEGRQPVELRLTRGPLSQQARPADDRWFAARPLNKERLSLAGAPGDMVPAVTVKTEGVAGDRVWTPVPDLLDSTPFDSSIVAEPGGPVSGNAAVPRVVDADGGSGGPDAFSGAGAIVRFGDGTYGADPQSGLRPEDVTYTAVYRVGNGPTGNVGAETLVHVATPSALPATWPLITAVRNPLPASDGVSPESIDEVRVAAPVAFSVDQRRAVTEADYVAALRRLPSVLSAVATFRWTGSWLTVFVGVEPSDPSDLLSLADGRNSLSPALESQVRRELGHVRLASYDIEVRPPQFAPLDLLLEVCVLPGHFRTEVIAAVRSAMGAVYQRDGRPGFFNPTRWLFGQTVWLSAIYAAVEAVPGVDSVEVVRFRRLGQPDNGEIDRGRLLLSPWEIARCDNDPNFAEHGVLTIMGHGGKG